MHDHILSRTITTFRKIKIQKKKEEEKKSGSAFCVAFTQVYRILYQDFVLSKSNTILANCYWPSFTSNIWFKEKGCELLNVQTWVFHQTSGKVWMGNKIGQKCDRAVQTHAECARQVSERSGCGLMYYRTHSWSLALCPRLPACYDTRKSQHNGASIVPPSLCTELQNHQLLRPRAYSSNHTVIVNAKWEAQATSAIWVVRVKLSRDLQNINIERSTCRNNTHTHTHQHTIQSTNGIAFH